MYQKTLAQITQQLQAQFAELDDDLAEELQNSTPVSEADIATAEQQLNTPFPPFYCALLQHFGTSCWLGIELDDLDQVIENTQWMRQHFANHPIVPQDILQNSIAFAGDGNGNYFLVHDSGVWLPDHDSNECNHEAPSLEQFILNALADNEYE